MCLQTLPHAHLGTGQDHPQVVTAGDIQCLDKRVRFYATQLPKREHCTEPFRRLSNGIMKGLLKIFPLERALGLRPFGYFYVPVARVVKTLDVFYRCRHQAFVKL